MYAALLSLSRDWDELKFHMVKSVRDSARPRFPKWEFYSKYFRCNGLGRAW
jgi:hypothetical protein